MRLFTFHFLLSILFCHFLLLLLYSNCQISPGCSLSCGCVCVRARVCVRAQACLCVCVWGGGGGNDFVAQAVISPQTVSHWHAPVCILCDVFFFFFNHGNFDYFPCKVITSIKLVVFCQWKHFYGVGSFGRLDVHHDPAWLKLKKMIIVMMVLVRVNHALLHVHARGYPACL